jgi:hypothetical protein
MAFPCRVALGFINCEWYDTVVLEKTSLPLVIAPLALDAIDLVCMCP